MPLYTLTCKKCGFTFEHLMLNPNAKLPRCEKCLEETETCVSHPAPPVMNSSNKPKGIKMDKDDGIGITTRYPHYADRNTGKSLGLGAPETVIG